MEQKLCLNSGLRKNKKGIVISMDAMVAVVIAVIILAVAYPNLTPRDSISHVAMSRLGGDAMMVLSHQNLVDSLNAALIDEELHKIIPISYQMKAKIECRNSPTIETNKTIPTRKEVGSGKIFFVTFNDYCSARYWIWQ